MGKKVWDHKNLEGGSEASLSGMRAAREWVRRGKLQGFTETQEEPEPQEQHPLSQITTQTS